MAVEKMSLRLQLLFCCGCITFCILFKNRWKPDAEVRVERKYNEVQIT